MRDAKRYLEKNQESGMENIAKTELNFFSYRNHNQRISDKDLAYFLSDSHIRKRTQRMLDLISLSDEKLLELHKFKTDELVELIRQLFIVGCPIFREFSLVEILLDLPRICQKQRHWTKYLRALLSPEDIDLSNEEDHIRTAAGLLSKDVKLFLGIIFNFLHTITIENASITAKNIAGYYGPEIFHLFADEEIAYDKRVSERGTYDHTRRRVCENVFAKIVQYTPSIFPTFLRNDQLESSSNAATSIYNEDSSDSEEEFKAPPMPGESSHQKRDLIKEQQDFDEKTLYSGYLRRQGDTLKSWAKRFFIVNFLTFQISYQKSPESDSDIKWIPVHGMQIFLNEDNEKRFVIETPGRTYRLQAKTSLDRDTWIAKFKQLVKLEAASYKTKTRKNRKNFGDSDTIVVSQTVDKNAAKRCASCKATFSIMKQKKTCSMCGLYFCSSCIQSVDYGLDFMDEKASKILKLASIFEPYTNAIDGVEQDEKGEGRSRSATDLKKQARKGVVLCLDCLTKKEKSVQLTGKSIKRQILSSSKKFTEALSVWKFSEMFTPLVGEYVYSKTTMKTIRVDPEREFKKRNPSGFVSHPSSSKPFLSKAQKEDAAFLVQYKSITGKTTNGRLFISEFRSLFIPYDPVKLDLGSSPEEFSIPHGVVNKLKTKKTTTPSNVTFLSSITIFTKDLRVFTFGFFPPSLENASSERQAFRSSREYKLLGDSYEPTYVILLRAHAFIDTTIGSAFCMKHFAAKRALQKSKIDIAIGNGWEIYEAESHYRDFLKIEELELSEEEFYQAVDEDTLSRAHGIHVNDHDEGSKKRVSGLKKFSPSNAAFGRARFPLRKYRIVSFNNNYGMIPSYPQVLAVPEISFDPRVPTNAFPLLRVKEICEFRKKGRMPTMVWASRYLPGSKSQIVDVTIWRCAQPATGIARDINQHDVALLDSVRLLTPSKTKTLYIIDCRPKVNALANKANGGGFEPCLNDKKLYHLPQSEGKYKNCVLTFCDIENIHKMRNSFEKLSKGLLDSNSSKKLYSGGRSYYREIHDSEWLSHVSQVLKATKYSVKIVNEFHHSIVIHCSDGWDRTSQISALTQICLDWRFRTMKGFATIIEKEWLSFGHKFHQRLGQFSKESEDSQRSPIFLQFLDAVYQLTVQFPSAFEFSSKFLVAIYDSAISGQYGTFFYNTEKERVKQKMHLTTESLWTDLIIDENLSSNFRNVLYDPRQQGCLSVSYSLHRVKLWEDFFLRYTKLENFSDSFLERKNQVEASIVVNPISVAEKKIKDLEDKLASLKTLISTAPSINQLRQDLHSMLSRETGNGAQHQQNTKPRAKKKNLAVNHHKVPSQSSIGDPNLSMNQIKNMLLKKPKPAPSKPPRTSNSKPRISLIIFVVPSPIRKSVSRRKMTLKVKKKP